MRAQHVALLAAALALTAPVASAVEVSPATREPAVFVVTTPSQSGVSEIWAAAPDGSRRELVGAVLGDAVAISPQGDRVASWWRSGTAKDDAPGRLYVSALDGRDRRAVAEVGNWVSWAPDGGSLLVSEASGTWVAYPDGRAPTPLTGGAGVNYAAFDPADGTRWVGVRGETVVVGRLGEDPVPVPGATGDDGISGPRLSPDGTSLAFVRSRWIDRGRGLLAEDVVVQSLDGSGQRVLVGPYGGFAWAPDGRSLLYTAAGGSSSASGQPEPYDIWQVPLDGSPASNLTRSPRLHERSVLGIGTRPAHDLAPALGSVTPTPESVGVTFTPSAGTTVRAYVALGVAPATRGRLLSGRADSPLAVPVTPDDAVTVTLVAVDAAGAEHGSTLVTAQAVGRARLQLPRLASSQTARLPLVVDPSPGNTRAVTAYEIDYARREASGARGPWTRWLSAAFSRGFGVDGTSAAPGSTWAFRARTVDRFGNAGPWVASSGTAIPYDDAAMRWSAEWRSVRSSGAWLGTVHTTSTAGRSGSLRGNGSSIAVIGRGSANSLRFRVYVDGVLRALVDPRRGSVGERQPLWSGRVAPGAHSVRIVSVATPGAKSLGIDAVSIAP